MVENFRPVKLRWHRLRVEEQLNNLLYGLAGIVAFAMIASSLRVSLSLKEFDLTAVTVGAVVILPNLTTTVAVFTGGRIIEADVNFNRVVTYEGMSASVNQIASPLLAIFLIAVVGYRSMRLKQFRISGLIYVSIIMLSALLSFRVMPGAQLTLIFVALAAATLRGGNTAAVGAGYAVSMLTALSFIGAFVAPSDAYIPCDARKCGVTGVLFSGIGDNQNSFGLLMALGVPFVYLGLRKWNRTLSAFTVLLALASGDRTAQIAALVTYLVLVACDARPAGLGRFPRLPILISGTGISLMVILPLVGLKGESLTGRPYYWALALARFEDSGLRGYGTDGWRSLVGAGVIPLQAGYSTHNQFVEALFFGGLIGAVLFGVLVCCIVKNAVNLPLLSIAAIPVIVCGITERPWSLDRIDWMSWSFVALVLLAHPIGGSSDSVEDKSSGGTIDTMSSRSNSEREGYDAAARRRFRLGGKSGGLP